MLAENPQKDFKPKFEVVSCFVEHDGKILLLLRQDHKSEPNTYGVPAGKVYPWETIDETISRELKEETWISWGNLQYFKKVFVRFPTYDFIYHMYHTDLSLLPDITLNTEEHKGYLWRTPEDALKENLIQDLDACIKMFYKI